MERMSKQKLRARAHKKKKKISLCSSKLKIYSVLLRNAKEVHNMEDLFSSLLLTFSLAPSLDVISEVRLRQAQTLLKPAPHSWQDKREAVGLAALKLLLGLSHDVAARRLSELLK